MKSGAIDHQLFRFSHAWTFVIIAGLFAWLIVSHGIPSLRHDWLFPIDRAEFVSRMLQLGTGWSSSGLGEANPYPMTYFVTLPLAAISLAIGPVAPIVLLVIAAGCALAYAGVVIARRLRTALLAGLGCALFLAFNPWTYNKIVAGHLTQIIAYAGLAIVLSELAAQDRSPRHLLAGMMLSALQTQFILIALAGCVLRLREREVRGAMLMGLLVFAPSIVGIALERQTLLSWPLTIPWEDAQSVPIGRGFLLNGYSAGYAQHVFDGAPAAGLWIVLGMAVAALAVPTRITLGIAACTFASLLFATGTSGVLASAWRWSIVHMPIIGVYREMYDVIAIPSIAYLVLAARTIARVQSAAWVLLGSSLLLLLAWFAHGPSAYWVLASELPAPDSAIRSVARYAVMPAFQPLSFKGRGSGADPLFVPYSPANAPINSLLPSYPVDAALGRFRAGKDVTALRRLGVGAVICRPGFSEALAAQYIYGRGILRTPRCAASIIVLAAPAPILGVADSASICSICPDAGSGNIFYGDMVPEVASALGMPTGGSFAPLAALRTAVDPAKAWIDARLIFAQRPMFAQPFGGAYTRSRTALGLPQAKFILASVRGTLADDRRRRISGSTRAYAWLVLPPETSTVTCNGECAIAGVGDPGPFAYAPPPHTTHAIEGQYVNAWIVRARVPAGGSRVLQFIEHYDPAWIALRWPELRPLVHVRLDGSLNGWVLPASSQSLDVVLIQSAALLQLLAGLIGFPIALVLLVRARAQEQ